jgi:hypothetical protein
MRRLLTAGVALMLSIVAAQAQTSDDIAARNVHRRAVEAVIWAMPAVNYDLMLQEMLSKTAGKVGQAIYWGRPLDWHNQTLTPNPDALYFMVFFNTKDGPVVLDLPSGISSPSGKCRWKTPGCLVRTRAKVENI